jgi:hypothetical protein
MSLILEMDTPISFGRRNKQIDIDLEYITSHAKLDCFDILSLEKNTQSKAT